MSWIYQKKDTLEKREFQHYFAWWVTLEFIFIICCLISYVYQTVHFHSPGSVPNPWGQFIISIPCIICIPINKVSWEQKILSAFKFRIALYINIFVVIITSSWTGDKALRELQEANISLQSFPILKECANKVVLKKLFFGLAIRIVTFYHVDLLVKAIKAATDKESKAPHLSGMSVITLEGALSFWFSSLQLCSYLWLLNFKILIDVDVQGCFYLLVTFFLERGVTCLIISLPYKDMLKEMQVSR